MKKIRTRYAPSPTGYLHIGGARTALFAYLFAKSKKGNFIIRSEDTDIKRNVDGGEASQINNLEWLGIVADESVYKSTKKYGPYRQSERLKLYNKFIKLLMDKELAYIAYDNSDELKEQKNKQKEKGIYSFRYRASWLKISSEEKAKRLKNKEYSIRLKLPKDTNYVWNDIVKSMITINSDEIGDFVIQKNDGYPTYNFACVIDDHFMEISHVFRGEEHISNTPKQIAIFKMFDWEIPIFGHFTIITNMEGKKLSKRDKTLDQFIEDYKDNGYVAHAIFNFLSLLGWSPTHKSEIMSHQKIIDDFDITRMSKSPSKFDIKKLQWFSNQYFKKLNIDELKERLTPYIEQEIKNKENYWIDLLLTTYQPQIYADYQIKELTKLFFKLPSLTLVMNDILNTTESEQILTTLLSLIEGSDFTLENIKDNINKTKDITGQKGRNLFSPIRLAVSHVERGPELYKTIFLIGKQEVINRLKKRIK